MSARVLIVLFGMFELGFLAVLMMLENRQRRKALPPEVSDIYDEKRYKKFLAYETDNRRSCVISFAVNLLYLVFFSCSNLFQPIERAANQNPYLIFLLTYAVFGTIERMLDSANHYYDTFHIEEKYGLNKAGKRVFFRNEALDLLQGTIKTVSFGLMIVYIGEHLRAWTQDFSVSIRQSLAIIIVITLAIALFAVAAAVLSIYIMHKKYCFTPLEDVPLRRRIMELQKGSRKKVHRISIYDESKKTNSKNAFLIRIFGYREIGIADNFLNENPEEEVLAVISHEIGHLKYRRGWVDHICSAASILILCALALLIKHPRVILNLNAWIRDSFGISVNNYYIWLHIVPQLFMPVIHLAEMLFKLRSRKEECEADLEAVRNGYGQALAANFKRLIKDELIDVNPHPFIEFLEFDHPGMYRRIHAINEAERRMPPVEPETDRG